MAGKVALADKLAGFSEHWSPRIVARYEGHEVRLAKLDGEFTWHSHTHDELFLIVSGELDIELRDRIETLGPGELIVIPRGTEHRPVARKGEVAALLLDPPTVRIQGTTPPPPWRWRLNEEENPNVQPHDFGRQRHREVQEFLP